MHDTYVLYNDPSLKNRSSLLDACFAEWAERKKAELAQEENTLEELKRQVSSTNETVLYDPEVVERMEKWSDEYERVRFLIDKVEKREITPEEINEYVAMEHEVFPLKKGKEIALSKVYLKYQESLAHFGENSATGLVPNWEKLQKKIYKNIDVYIAAYLKEINKVAPNAMDGIMFPYVWKISWIYEFYCIVFAAKKNLSPRKVEKMHRKIAGSDIAYIWTECTKTLTQFCDSDKVRLTLTQDSFFHVDLMHDKNDANKDPFVFTWRRYFHKDSAGYRATGLYADEFMEEMMWRKTDPYGTA